MQTVSASVHVIDEVAAARPPQAATAYALVSDKLARVEARLASRMRCNVDRVDGIAQYLEKSRGKRLRPMILLLISQMLGEDFDDRDVRYASIVEMLHMATLVHDDVIDGARLRHGRASMNTRWGNTVSVLFGDLLFTKSIDQLIAEGDLRILKLLSDATHSMVIGEILELEYTGNMSITAETALEIIQRKTADLFAAACAVPAYLQYPRGMTFVEPLTTYGREVGIAFQLIDDILDYTATEDHLGKPVLSDLCEGKVTMPLILALPHASESERECIATVLRERTFRSVQPEEVLRIAQDYDGLSATYALAVDHCTRARLAVASLPDSEGKNALLEATDYLTTRTR